MNYYEFCTYLYLIDRCKCATLIKEIRIKQLFYYVLLCYIPVLVVHVSHR